MKIDDIKPYSKNAKKHTTKQIKQVADSIKEFGFNQPIVVDKKGVIIVGHGRYEASKLLKLKEVPIKVVDLTEEQAKSYRLADNKLNESEWDKNLILEELEGLSMPMLDLTGFSRDLILQEEDSDDDIPDIPRKAKAKYGEIYQLGQHRIMCGDATKDEDFKKLMEEEISDMVFTDPPYNVDYQGGMGTHEKNKREGIMNDKMSDDDFRYFLEDTCGNIIANTKGGIYICMSSSELTNLKGAFEVTGGHWQSFVIWVKSNFTLSRADYQNTYEPILYGWPDNTKKHYFIEDRDNPTTMKPVALVSTAILNSSKRGEIVLDPFLGGGSTLIAAEKTGRICYGMELDPKYIDVIIKRWEKFTGSKAEKI